MARPNWVTKNDDVQVFGLTRCKAELEQIGEELQHLPTTPAVPTTDAANRANTLANRQRVLRKRAKALEAAVAKLADEPWTEERALAWLKERQGKLEKYQADQERIAKAREALAADPHLKLDLSERVPKPAMIPASIQLPSDESAFIGALGAVQEGNHGRWSGVVTEMLAHHFDELRAEAKARGLNLRDQEVIHAILEPGDNWAPPEGGLALSGYLDPESPQALPYVGELNGPRAFQAWLEAMADDKRGAERLRPVIDDVIAEATARGWLERMRGPSPGGYAFSHDHRPFSVHRLFPEE